MSSDNRFSNGPSATTRLFSEEAALHCLVSHALARDMSITNRIPLANSASPGRLCDSGPNGIVRAYAALVRTFRSDSLYHLTLTREGRLKLTDGRYLDYMIHVRLDQPVSSHWDRETTVTARPLQIHAAASQLTDSLFTVQLEESDGTPCYGSGFISFGSYHEASGTPLTLTA